MISLSSLLAADVALCHLSSYVMFVNLLNSRKSKVLTKITLHIKKKGQTLRALGGLNLSHSSVQRWFQPQSLCYCFPSVK